MLFLKPKALSFLTLKVASLGCLSPQLGFVNPYQKLLPRITAMCVCVVLADIHWPENVKKAECKDHATHDLVVA